MCSYHAIPVGYPFPSEARKAACVSSWCRRHSKSESSHPVWHRKLLSPVAVLPAYRICQRSILHFRLPLHGRKPYLLHQSAVSSRIPSVHPVVCGCSVRHLRHRYHRYIWRYQIQRSHDLSVYPLAPRTSYRNASRVCRYHNISWRPPMPYVGTDLPIPHRGFL